MRVLLVVLCYTKSLKNIINESWDKVNYRNLNDNEMLYMVSDNSEDMMGYICEKYKPIVLGIAKRYYKYAKNTIIDFDDVVQGGFYALLNAVKQYDVNKGVTFYTFSLKCITNGIVQVISNSNRKYIKNSAYYNPIDDIVYEKACYCKKEIEVDETFSDFCFELEYEDSLVFILRLNGFSYKEISCLLDMKYKKVDYVLQKCKNKLKKSLFV